MFVRGCRRVAGGTWRGALVGGLVGLISACSPFGSSVKEPETPQIGLQRGGRWSVLTLKPPHLTGPHFNLMLKGGVLTGSISGGNAPAGNLHVNIADDGIEGYGPLGPVSVDFITTEDSTVADGMWNGLRVHIVFTKESVKGTVAENSDFNARSDPEARQGLRAFRGQSRSGPTGASQIDPLPNNSSCEYFLTDVTPEGALTGGSICAGMPQPTRLEVPKMAGTYLTKPELVTLLVAVLSAPPTAAAEYYGPRFDHQSLPPPTPPPPVIRRR
jgi:hypothetical protein